MFNVITQMKIIGYFRLSESTDPNSE